MDQSMNKTEIYVDESDLCSLPFSATRDDQAPIFSAESYVNLEIKTINLQEYRGKWVILFFYTSDFTFV